MRGDDIKLLVILAISAGLALILKKLLDNQKPDTFLEEGEYAEEEKASFWVCFFITFATLMLILQLVGSVKP